MNVPTRNTDFQETFAPTPHTIPGDLDIVRPLVGEEVVFDQYALEDPPDDPMEIPLNSALPAPEPSAALLLLAGAGSLGIAAAVMRGLRLLRRAHRAHARPNRSRVRREIRMMA